MILTFLSAVITSKAIIADTHVLRGITRRGGAGAVARTDDPKAHLIAAVTSSESRTAGDLKLDIKA